MKAFTLWQPWASLVAISAKPNEFRERPYTEYRDPPKPGERVAVHAGMRRVRRPEVWELLQKIETGDPHTGLSADLARPLLWRIFNAHDTTPVIELGAVLATAVIGPPILACDLYGLEVADSDRGDFNWAWPLGDVQRLEAPIAMRGKQGFWRLPDAMLTGARAA